VTSDEELVGDPRTTETGEGGVPRLFVMVGLPSAGKTSRARELASRWNALRLTPDEWMIPLFGQEQPEGKRNVLEGRLIWLALSALRSQVGTARDLRTTWVLGAPPAVSIRIRVPRVLADDPGQRRSSADSSER
jgi:hypothetical protein